MEYFGQVRILGARRGVSRRDGKEWVARQFEVRPLNSTGRKGVLLEVFGDDRWSAMQRGGLADGAIGTVHFDISVDEWEGKRFNTFYVISFKPYTPKGGEERPSLDAPGFAGDDGCGELPI